MLLSSVIGCTCWNIWSNPPLSLMGNMARGWDDPFDSHHLHKWQRAGFRLRENLLCYTSQPSNFSGSNDGGLGLAGNGGPAVKQCKLHQCTAKQTQRLSPLTTLTFELTLATVLWNSRASNQADRNSTSFQSGKRRRGINAMTHAGASRACVRAASLLQAPFGCWRIKSRQRSQTKNLSMMVSWQAWWARSCSLFFSTWTKKRCYNEEHEGRRLCFSHEMFGWTRKRCRADKSMMTQTYDKGFEASWGQKHRGWSIFRSI